MNAGSFMARAAVRRELAELEAVDAAINAGLRMRSESTTSTSVVFSVRLDRHELRALERRALIAGIKPSVLARNLIRVGLSSSGSPEAARVVERLAQVVDELRALTGSSPMRTGFD
jgi:hypothetical protein